MDNPIDSKSKNLALAAHLLGLIVLVGIPFGNIIGPLILWLVCRDKSPFIDQHGKEALNFQISISIYALGGFLLTFVFIGLFVLFALIIFDIVFVIKASIAASKGENYTYPYTIRLIK